MNLSPVIILGMHRSGTSMLTMLLKKMGLFVGNDLDPFDLNESLFFISLNDWLLNQCNAGWDNVYNYQFMDEFMLEKAIPLIKGELAGKKRKKYLGTSKGFKHKNIADLDIPWGWKDPRNTITIDLWKRIFPDAKILHIYRNPIDVAQSLRKREQEIRAHSKLEFYVKILKFLDYKAIQTLSPRMLHLEEGVKLWEDYVQRALALSEQYGEQVKHIRYEDFLESPAPILSNVIDFIDLPTDKKKIEKAVEKVDSSRKFAFLKNEELVSLYKKVQARPLLQKLQYGQLV